MTTAQTKPEHTLTHVLDALQSRQRFVIASHARPDGDATGSQLAMAHALTHLGKTVTMVSRDPPPPYLRSFPRVSEIEITDRVTGDFDVAVVLECGTLERTEVTGLEQHTVVNIDHHIGNTMYGSVNWFDDTAAACGEMVFDVVNGLGVPLTTEIATVLYIAILTDTGAFHHANITARTFDICGRIAETGVSPAGVAAQVYQHGTLGKLRLTGALLDQMELVGNGRVGVLHVHEQLLRETGGAADDMEGLINLPLAAKEIQAVVLFKELDEHLRVSVRSKGTIDVRAVAVRYGGGGHRNAAGFSVATPLSQSRGTVVADIVAAVDAGTA